MSWTPIPDFPGYQAHPDGYIMNASGRILKGTEHCGYLRVNLVPKNKQLIHRLIALTFLPNPDGYSTVDHINRDKKDNSVQNLRWVTQMENGNNKSGGKCIYWSEANKGFQVMKTIRGHRFCSKYFKTREEAEDWLHNIAE
jgi:hypothetical protein